MIKKIIKYYINGFWIFIDMLLFFVLYLLLLAPVALLEGFSGPEGSESGIREIIDIVKVLLFLVLSPFAVKFSYDKTLRLESRVSDFKKGRGCSD